VDGGNRTLLAKVLDVIGTDVRLNTEVTSISGQGDRWLVGTDAGTEAFDAVVLAAPLALADLDLSHSGSPLDYPVHPYQQVHVTLVVGEPSPAYFGVDPTRRFPSQVFVADSAGAPFKSLGITGFSPTHQQRIYKIFSAEVELSDEVLGQIFASIAEVRRWVWRGAYPKLTPGLAHVPFVLAPGLFYGCAFETAAGAIEVEAVGGHNAASLAVQYLR
jgi:glycine/D-amino acid oxidase-like deaminating enzyme